MTSHVQTHRNAVTAAAVGLPLLICAVLMLFPRQHREHQRRPRAGPADRRRASTGIRRPGSPRPLSSAVWFDFFLTEPYHQFAITDPADLETAALLVLVGIAVTEIALWGRRQQARASREQGYLDGVLEHRRDRRRRPHVHHLADRPCVRPDRRGAATRRLPLRPSTTTRPGHPRSGRDRELRRPPDRRGAAGLPTDTEIALPVRSGGVVHGRFLLTAATRVVRPPRTTPGRVALANQVGAALGAAPRA